MIINITITRGSNETLDDVSLYQTVRIAVVTAIAVLVVFTNVKQIRVLWKDRLCRTTCREYYGYYLLHMNVVAIATAVVYIPLVITCRECHMGCNFKALSFLHALLSAVTVFSLVCMIRKRNVKHHLYRQLRPRDVKYSLYLVWLCSLVVALPRLFEGSQLYWINSDTVFPSTLYKVYLFAYAVVVLLITLSLVLYDAITISRRNMATALLLHRKKMYDRFTNFTLVMITLYLFCSAPVVLMEAVNRLVDTELKYYAEKLYEGLLYLSWFGHFAYSLLYQFMYPQQKKEKPSDRRPTNRTKLRNCTLRRSSNHNAQNEQLLTFFYAYCDHLLINPNPNADDTSAKLRSRSFVTSRRGAMVTDENVDHVIHKLKPKK